MIHLHYIFNGTCTVLVQVIVHPESTGDVSKVLQLCHEFGVPVVAFGGGTSLEGQTMASQGGVSLDMNSMTQVLEVNDQDLDCTVQAGLGYQELNRLLKGIYIVHDILIY